MTSTLEIYVKDTISFGDTFGASSAPFALTPYFKPAFTFAVPKDVAWAPARSRAPSVTISFDFLEAAF